jgi:predicted ATPase
MSLVRAHVIDHAGESIVAIRIALAGAHATGKTTLAAELARALPGHRVVEEPYYELEAEGYVFAASPTVEDFEAQLERSLRNVREERGDVIFDRSPADHLAYMLAHRDASRADVSAWLPRIADALATLDLIVFVPIERPDRIAAEREASRLRRRVDATLRAALVGDEWGLGLEVLEVRGTPGERAQQVLARLAAISAALDESRYCRR